MVSDCFVYGAVVDRLTAGRFNPILAKRSHIVHLRQVTNQSRTTWALAPVSILAWCFFSPPEGRQHLCKIWMGACVPVQALHINGQEVRNMSATFHLELDDMPFERAEVQLEWRFRLICEWSSWLEPFKYTGPNARKPIDESIMELV